MRAVVISDLSVNTFNMRRKADFRRRGILALFTSKLFDSQVNCQYVVIHGRLISRSKIAQVTLYHVAGPQVCPHVLSKTLLCRQCLLAHFTRMVHVHCCLRPTLNGLLGASVDSWALGDFGRVRVVRCSRSLNLLSSNCKFIVCLQFFIK
jgi:hypothetical protein